MDIWRPQSIAVICMLYLSIASAMSVTSEINHPDEVEGREKRGTSYDRPPSSYYRSFSYKHTGYPTYAQRSYPSYQHGAASYNTYKGYDAGYGSYGRSGRYNTGYGNSGRYNTVGYNNKGYSGYSG